MSDWTQVKRPTNNEVIWRRDLGLTEKTREAGDRSCDPWIIHYTTTTPLNYNEACI